MKHRYHMDVYIGGMWCRGGISYGVNEKDAIATYLRTHGITSRVRATLMPEE